MKIILSAISFLIFLPAFLLAETVSISKEIDVSFDVPPGWILAAETPELLLQEMAEHIKHEAAEKNKNPTDEQIMMVAKKRLSANEALLFNPATKSYITIDFSHLRQGEKPPNKKTIDLSAKYAGQGMKEEEGVTGAKPVTSKVKIEGAWYASRLDVSYKHHDDDMHFTGVIGFVAPYWFFIYSSNYLQDPEDKNKIEQFFKSLQIIKS